MVSKQFSFFEQSEHSQENLSRLRTIVWLVTICTGFLQAWASRFAINPDGNSYLDIATAYLHGDWSNAINAYWSPLFSWLLALCLGIVRPGPYWESTVIHLLNFCGLLLSLCTFEFFFRAFLRLQERWRSSKENGPLPEFGWWVLGYALFVSTSLRVLSIIDTNPDVWVAVLTYLVAGFVLHIALNGGGWRLFVALGFALGFAYLTKAVYFPLSFIFLATAWLATRSPRKTARQALLGVLTFTLVGGPWVAVLSRSKHRFAFGDAGRIAFSMFYDPLQQAFFWQGETGTGTPVHPIRQILARPRLYEFATPVAGAYPPTLDPSYWLEGVQPHFHFRSLIKVLRQSIGTLFQIGKFKQNLPLLRSFCFCFCLRWRNGDVFSASSSVYGPHH